MRDRVPRFSSRRSAGGGRALRAALRISSKFVEVQGNTQNRQWMQRNTHARNAATALLLLAGALGTVVPGSPSVPNVPAQKSSPRQRGRGIEEVPVGDVAIELAAFADRNEPLVVRAAIEPTFLDVWQDDEQLRALSDRCMDSSCDAETSLVAVRTLPRDKAPQGAARFVRHGHSLGYSKRNLTIHEFLNHYNNSTHPEVLYLAQADVAVELPYLGKVLPPFPLPPGILGEAAPTAPTTVYWGAHDTITQLHYDSRDNLVCVLSGAKNFSLVDPFTSSAVLYSREDRDGNSSPVALDLPDEVRT